MLSYTVLPRPMRSLRALLVPLALGGVLACGGSQPQVHVIGVAPEGDRVEKAPEEGVVVFLEVVNRTGRELELSRLEYRLSAPSWFEVKGKRSLRRHIDADSSVVVEIPVDLSRFRTGDAAEEEVRYQLEGRLVTREQRQERSWPVQSSGRLRAVEGKGNVTSMQVRVAAGE